MSIFYASCSEDILNHVCDPCDEGEGDGVRHVFYYKDGSFAAAPTKTEFEQGVESGDVIVISDTRGTFDGGTPTYGKGYGDRISSYESSTYKVTYSDRNYVRNRAFYNGLQSQTSWNFGWKSETQIHLSEKKVTAYGKDPHTDDITKKVVWEVEVTWASKTKPLIYDSPDGIFECFQIL